MYEDDHELIERAPAKRRSGGLLKKFVNSDFSRELISAKKRAGVTRCSHATTRRCSDNHQFNQRSGQPHSHISLLFQCLLPRQSNNRYVQRVYDAGTRDYQYPRSVLEKVILFHIVTFFIKHATIVAPLVEELPKPMHFQEMFHRLHLRGFQRRSAENANVNGHCHGL